MNCHKFREIFSDYIDGALDAGLSVEAGKHLADCADCSSLVDAALANRDMLTGLPELDPGPDLMKKLYAIPAPPKRTVFQAMFDFLGRPSVQPALTALTLLMIFFTFLSGHPEGKALRKSLDREFHSGISQVEKLYARSGKVTSEVGTLADSVLNKFKTLKPDKGEKDK